jgi:isopenicillin N synthase-like dioxygenase
MNKNIEPAPSQTETAVARSSGDRHRAAVKSVPIIDLSSYLSSGREIERQAIAQELRKACIDVGFFYLSGHGFPDGELAEAIEWGHRFFNLPIEVKMRFAAKDAGGMGFVRVGGLNPAGKASADVKERYIIMRNTRQDDGDGSHWPDDDVLPGFAAFMKQHLARRVSLAKALVQAFARSLDLPETYFDPYYRNLSYNSIINYYPPLDAETVENNRWSFSPHTDYGGFTLLSQDSLGGLQVRNSAGEWIEVPPIDNTFVVNIGDLTARWTNDLYTSTLHRAANVSGAARISIPFFASPENSAVISTIETCIDEQHPSRYPPVVSGEYLRALIAQADTTGKPGISDRTAKRLQAG